MTSRSGFIVPTKNKSYPSASLCTTSRSQEWGVVDLLHAFIISLQVEMLDQHRGNINHQTCLEADITSLLRVLLFTEATRKNTDDVRSIRMMLESNALPLEKRVGSNVGGEQANTRSDSTSSFSRSGDSTTYFS